METVMWLCLGFVSAWYPVAMIILVLVAGAIAGLLEELPTVPRR